MLDINIFYIICIILTQSIVLIVIFQSLFLSGHTGYQIEVILRIVPYLLYIVMVLTVVTVISVSKLFNMALKKRELEVQEANSRHIRALNEVLRGQRHDFNNHMQIIYSLVLKGKYPSALRYLEDLTGEIIQANELLDISSPVISAIVTAKLHLAKSRGVGLEYDIQGEFENGKIKVIHLSRILGNLLDNAIEGAEEAGTEDRKVSLLLYSDSSGIFMDIKNPGHIREEVLERIFEPGVSTKEGKSRGMGLYVVKDIVDMYNGRVEVASGPGKGVRVLVELPRGGGGHERDKRQDG